MKGDGKGEPPYYKDSLTTDIVMRVEVCVDSSSASSRLHIVRAALVVRALVYSCIVNKPS